jgi:hypothetical protein
MTGLVLARLHVRFLLLVLLAVIPALGLVVYTASERQRLVRFAAGGRPPTIEDIHQLLAGLAHAPDVRGGASAAYPTLRAPLLPRDPSAASFGANTPDDTLFCRARSSPSLVHAANRSSVRRAFDTRAFAMGEDEAGRVTGKTSVHGGEPILDETSAVQTVVFVPLDLAWINYLVTEAQRPSRASLPVLDLHLVGQDGREVLAPLQREHTLQSIPVNVPTTSADPCAIDACDQASEKSNVQKPPNFDRLMQAIQRSRMVGLRSSSGPKEGRLHD